MIGLTKILALSSIAAASSTTSKTSRLISEQMTAYKTLLGGSDKLTKNGFIKLLQMHDSDTICQGSCDRYLDNMFGDSGSMDFSRLEKLVNEIYGDLISSDPFQPQEVHISLTDYPDQMKGNKHELKFMFSMI